MDKEKLKYINEYLNEKPEKKKGKWNWWLALLAKGAKAYLRYKGL